MNKNDTRSLKTRSGIPQGGAAQRGGQRVRHENRRGAVGAPGLAALRSALVVEVRDLQRGVTHPDEVVSISDEVDGRHFDLELEGSRGQRRRVRFPVARGLLRTGRTSAAESFRLDFGELRSNC